MIDRYNVSTYMGTPVEIGIDERVADGDYREVWRGTPKDVLDMRDAVTRLTAENERLTTEVATAKTIAVNIGVSYEQCKAELERLQQRHNILGRENTRILNERDAAVAECERLRTWAENSSKRVEELTELCEKYYRDHEAMEALRQAADEWSSTTLVSAREFETERIVSPPVWRFTAMDGSSFVSNPSLEGDPADAILAAKGGGE